MTGTGWGQELVGKSLLQLRELAQRLGIQRYTALDKGGLIQAVSQMAPQPDSVPAAADLVGTSDRVSTTPGSPAVRPEPGTQVVFLPRDPQWAYVFWEISSADRERAAATGAGQLCLRVADVTGLPLGASHPHALQELVVDVKGNEWYLPVPLSDREYRVELGYRLAAGGWLSLAHSAVAR